MNTNKRLLQVKLACMEKQLSGILLIVMKLPALAEIFSARAFMRMACVEVSNVWEETTPLDPDFSTMMHPHRQLEKLIIETEKFEQVVLNLHHKNSQIYVPFEDMLGPEAFALYEEIAKLTKELN